jgi:hypothetical protein
MSAAASQPWQHIGRSSPSIFTNMVTPGGTGKPQWKQASGALASVVAGAISDFIDAAFCNIVAPEPFHICIFDHHGLILILGS